MTSILEFLRNDQVQTLLVAALVILGVFGFLYGSQVVMHTKTLPVFIVSTGSMCVPLDRNCDGWSHPFAQTIHVGDIIVIEGINPKNLNFNYPNSDVIVFQNPSDTTGVPIVHRLTSEIVKNGKYYFYTKGDGNPPAPWPNPAEKYAPDQGWYDPAYYNENPTVPVGSIPQDLVIGRVVMRIPWIGWVTILTAGLQDWITQQGINAVALIVIIIATLLISLELALPHMKPRRKAQYRTTPHADSHCPQPRMNRTETRARIKNLKNTMSPFNPTNRKIDLGDLHIQS